MCMQFSKNIELCIDVSRSVFDLQLQALNTEDTGRELHISSKTQWHPSRLRERRCSGLNTKFHAYEACSWCSLMLETCEEPEMDE